MSALAIDIVQHNNLGAGLHKAPESSLCGRMVIKRPRGSRQLDAVEVAARILAGIGINGRVDG
jgi:hypothetical protein